MIGIRALVRVGASASDLGASASGIALALDRWLTISAHIDETQVEPVRVERAPTLAALAHVDASDDRIVAGFRAATESRGRALPHGVHIRASSQIPIARGLGASAAAAVAGVLAANTVLRLGLLDDAVVEIASSVERDAGAVAAAVLGGAVMASAAGDGAPRVVAEPIATSASLAFVVGVPDVAVAREHDDVPHDRDANQAGSLARALADGDAARLVASLDDARRGREIVPAYDDVRRAARDAGAFGTTPSGGGPSVVAIAPASRAAAAADAIRAAWDRAGIRADVFEPSTNVTGYTVRAQQECEPAPPARRG